MSPILMSYSLIGTGWNIPEVVAIQLFVSRFFLNKYWNLVVCSLK